MITATIKGPDLAAAVKASHLKIEANTERSLDKVAGSTQKDAQTDCPVRTGLLKSDIKIYKQRLLRQIGNNVFYSWLVHNGTKYMRARPYLLNSFNKNYRGFITDIKAMKL